MYQHCTVEREDLARLCQCCRGLFSELSCWCLLLRQGSPEQLLRPKDWCPMPLTQTSVSSRKLTVLWDGVTFENCSQYEQNLHGLWILQLCFSAAEQVPLSVLVCQVSVEGIFRMYWERMCLVYTQTLEGCFGFICFEVKSVERFVYVSPS